MSDYIKNPNRDKIKVPEKYVPEYIRLGKEPALMNMNYRQQTEIEEFNIPNEPDEPTPNNNEEVFASLDDIYEDEFDDITEVRELPISPDVGQYILLVNGESILVSGDILEIENKVKKIAYGDDEDFPDKIEMTDIVVLKRVGLKIGIFIEE